MTATSTQHETAPWPPATCSPPVGLDPDQETNWTALWFFWNNSAALPQVQAALADDLRQIEIEAGVHPAGKVENNHAN